MPKQYKHLSRGILTHYAAQLDAGFLSIIIKELPWLPQWELRANDKILITKI